MFVDIMGKIFSPYSIFFTCKPAGVGESVKLFQIYIFKSGDAFKYSCGGFIGIFTFYNMVACQCVVGKNYFTIFL